MEKVKGGKGGKGLRVDKGKGEGLRVEKGKGEELRVEKEEGLRVDKD